MARDWNNNEMSFLEFEFEVAVAVEVFRVGPKCFILYPNTTKPQEGRYLGKICPRKMHIDKEYICYVTFLLCKKSRFGQVG